VRVIVVGGGPGGSITASRLRQLGHDVIVFEKETFPRFHIGESLLPKSLPVLEKIGVLAQVDERFLTKRGARFHDDIAKKKDRFSFTGAWKPDPSHAYQVERETFDDVLLDRARQLGADVRMPVKVDRVLFDGDRAVGVEAGGARIEADFVIDATGRDHLIARAEGSQKIEGLDQTSYFTHYTGVPRAAGDEEGDVDIILFDSGKPSHPNWLWLIPFKSGVTSVGAVVSRHWLRARPSAKPNDMLRDAIRCSPTAEELLRGGEPIWDEAQAIADFSYRIGKIRGPGWLAIGDAGGFIDPLFSTGVHIAMTGGMLAAEALDATVSGDSAAFEAWETKVRAAAETFILAVQAFYRGPLVEHLFVADKHTALRRSITSLLAGDVYGDSIWLRDVRLRLKEMVATGA
jgi:flavin-dependent dehydrogenase